MQADLIKHKLKEHLGGSVNLLTIDAVALSGKAGELFQIVNHFGETGAGVVFAANTYKPHPYKVGNIKKQAKSSKTSIKINIADNDDYSFSRYIEEMGGALEGAQIYEYQVYERFLDAGATPNAQAYILKFKHEINYIEQAADKEEIIIHTIDPLSKQIEVPSVSFSAGDPNSTQSYINVFPAVTREIANTK